VFAPIGHGVPVPVSASCRGFGDRAGGGDERRGIGQSVTQGGRCGSPEGMVESEVPLMDMVIRLTAAVALAAVVGLDREIRGMPAGLRTHMLVALGAAAFLLVGFEILFATAEGDPSARIDPTRIVEGVIGGIGFLGAGSIIRSGGTIHGITSGAAIWVAGAIGVACATGNIILAAMVTAFAVVIIALLGLIEPAIAKARRRG